MRYILGSVLYLLTSAASFAQPIITEIPVPPSSGATALEPLGISYDGSVIVGDLTVNGAPHAFRWTAAGGSHELAPMGVAFYQTVAIGVSSDGTVIVGRQQDTPFGDYYPVIWDIAGPRRLTSPFGGSDMAVGVSGNGAMIVGECGLPDGNGTQAFAWSTSGIPIHLGGLGGSYSTPFAISPDGLTVTGGSAPHPPASTCFHAFRWNDGAMADLGTLGGTYSTGRAISADGAVIAGISSLPGDTEHHAFRWTKAGGMQDLGLLNGQQTEARSMSADGGIIIGGSPIPFGEQNAFIWTESCGMMDLRAYLTGIGLDLTGWQLGWMGVISGDGTTLAGRAVYEGRDVGFVIRGIPSPGVLPLAAMATALTIRRRRSIA